MAAEILAVPDIEAQFLSVLAAQSEMDPAKARDLAAQSLVTPDRLYVEAHREVLTAILDLAGAGKPADAASIFARVGQSRAVLSAGGYRWLLQLCNATSGVVGSLPTYAAKIREMALRRKLLGESNELRASVLDLSKPVEFTLNEKASALASITLATKTRKTLIDVITDCSIDMQDAALGKSNRMVRTGLVDFDGILGGGLPPTLTIVGALPGVGKSALFATICCNAARLGHKIGIFSLEDEARWLGWRVMAAETGIPQTVLKKGSVLGTAHRERLDRGFERISEYAGQILIDDRCGLTAPEIVQSATDMIVNEGVEAVFVDHAGEISLADMPDERHDIALTRALQLLRDVSKARRVPVVVASHLHRKPNQKSDDAPTLTDFKNTSSLEGMARVALGLSRRKGSDELFIHVLKNTNGEVGDIKLKFHGLAGMVKDCEDRPARDWYGEREFLNGGSI